MDDDSWNGEDELVTEIGDVLDLHTFAPSDVQSLVADYLDEALERGYDQVRIVHGKGKGVLRRIVHSVLEKHEGVAEYHLAGEGAGQWGATLVRLRRFPLSAPAALRNREPILEILERYLPAPEPDRPPLVLEIASGSGEHSQFFATALPDYRWQPSDPDQDARRSIGARRGELAAANLLPPLALDVTEADWPIDRADAVLCINMIHIAPWQACEGLFRGAARILDPGAPLITYGPYRVEGEPFAPSNEAFDASLRARDPRWGVRSLEDVIAVAKGNGFAFDARHAMPANNLTLIFRRRRD